jgi:hypothetical protein
MESGGRYLEGYRIGVLVVQTQDLSNLVGERAYHASQKGSLDGRQDLATHA